MAGTGSWVYAAEGPGTARVAEGDVVGFHFTTSESATAAPLAPRGATEHAEICPGDPAGVAVVIDFGTADGAPAARTACAPDAAGTTAATALAAVAEPLRYASNGMLCGITGYPETGCGEAAPAASEDTANESDDGASPLPVIAALSAVAVLAVAGLWRARRRDRS